MKPGFLVASALVVLYMVRRWRSLGTETKMIAVVMAAGFAAYGAGLFELPNIENLIEDVGKKLGKWTYALVAVMAFLETGAFVGLIAPGEFTILLGGVVAGQGRISIVVLIALVWACAVLGDSVSFYFGHRLGRRFLERHGPRVKITEERLQQVERFFDRHGGATILIGRFVGLVRAIAPFIAGASKMRFRRFLPFDVVGAGLWGATFCLLGYFFWHSFDKVANLAGKGAFALGATIAVVVGGVWLYRWLKVPANRAEVEAWIRRREDRPGWRLLFAAVTPAYRRVLVPAWRVLSVPVGFFRRRVTPGDLGLELTTLLAIALVGGFVFGALASLVHSDSSLYGDARSLQFADDIRTGFMDDVAKVATHLGDLAVVGPLVLLAVVYLLVRREVVEGVAIAAGLVATYAGIHISKAAVGRPRPPGSLVETSGSAFPSGHAAYSIALIAVAVAFRHAIPGLARRSVVVVVAVVLVALVGASRVYLRAHRLTDVLGGFALGFAAFAVCALVGLIVARVRQNARSSTRTS